MSSVDLEDLRAAVTHQPGDAETWHALGIAALAEGEIDEAGVAFTRSVSLAPHDLAQASIAAERLAGAGCTVEAEEILRLVLERTPGAIEPRIQLAPLLMKLAADFTQLGDTRGAVRCRRRIVTLTRGRDTEALTALGISLSSDGQHAEAVQVLKEVTRRQSQSAAALSDLGTALSAAGRLDEAVASFRRALDLDPAAAPAYCGLGIVYQRQGRLQEAAEAFRATEQFAPENAAGPLNLGIALHGLGDRDGARRALLRAAALEPDDPDTQAALDVLFGPAEVHRDAPPATPPPVPHGFGASITGNLASFQLFDVLEFLRLQKKTGRLVVSSSRGTGVVRLVDGAVTSASAPEVKRLGEALLDSRLITRPQLDHALAHQREEPRKSTEALGSVLLRDKIIDRDRLAVAIRRQVLAALESMLTWHEGEFSFHRAHGEEDDDPPPVSFDLQDVMLKLMRLTDERKAGRPPRLD